MMTETNVAPTDFCIVYTTAPNEREATLLAKSAIEGRLAACCSTLPGARSFFQWQGTLHIESEYLLMFKTRSSLFEALSAMIREVHSYEVPEIIAVPLSGGSPEYLQWLLDETAHPKERGGSDGN